MTPTLAAQKQVPEPFADAVDPVLEAGAYEALWIQDGMTEKKMADLFRNRSRWQFAVSSSICTPLVRSPVLVFASSKTHAGRNNYYG